MYTYAYLPPSAAASTGEDISIALFKVSVASFSDSPPEKKG